MTNCLWRRSRGHALVEHICSLFWTGNAQPLSYFAFNCDKFSNKKINGKNNYLAYCIHTNICMYIVYCWLQFCSYQFHSRIWHFYNTKRQYQGKRAQRKFIWMLVYAVNIHIFVLVWLFSETPARFLLSPFYAISKQFLLVITVHAYVCMRMCTMHIFVFLALTVVLYFACVGVYFVYCALVIVIICVFFRPQRCSRHLFAYSVQQWARLYHNRFSLPPRNS